MTLTNEMLTDWANALRSGEFKQIEGTLHTKQDGIDYYCCLGVACRVWNGPSDEELDSHKVSAHELGYKFLKNQGIVDLQYFYYKNDILKWSFKEIADHIDANRDTIISETLEEDDV
jgi:hypothetical protein